MFFKIKNLFFFIFFFIFFFKINFSAYQIKEIGLNKFSKGEFENYLFKVYDGKIKFYLD